VKSFLFAAGFIALCCLSFTTLGESSQDCSWYESEIQDALDNASNSFNAYSDYVGAHGHSPYAQSLLDEANAWAALADDLYEEAESNACYEV